MYYVSISIAILGLVVYQFAVKTAPEGPNPWWLLATAYAIAAVLCVAAAPLWARWVGGDPCPLTARNVGAAAFIGVSAILIEIGYLLVYRNGWTVSTAPAVAQGFTIAIVLVLGVVLGRDRPSLVNVLGVVLAIAGIALVTYKPVK
jgi:drug/metabolite transporter (DMT)-like permease